jgi:hypothetical protein
VGDGKDGKPGKRGMGVEREHGEGRGSMRTRESKLWNVISNCRRR